MAQISNSLAPTKSAKLTFSQALETDSYKKLLASSIQDPKRRARFVTAVVSAVSANPTLQRCDAKSIISSALQGEALELSPSPALGEYWIIPYRVGKPDFAHPENDVYQAQFQLGVAGRIQLAMRTGEYADIDTVEIREGEYLGRDSRNGKPKFKFIEDETEREQKPIIGYLAYFELLNGFYHSVYFPKEKVLAWADRYSKAFDRKLYERYIKGEVKDWNVELLTGSLLDGLEAYKRKHGIKTEKSNASIILPYKKSEELCVQIANLKTKVSGLSLKEERKSKAIQRDIWSALKYALRMAQILEGEKVKKKYKKKSSWSDTLEKGFCKTNHISCVRSARTQLLKNRKR